MEPEEILRDVLAALESWVVGVFAPAETCLRGVKTAELFVRKMIEFDPEVVKGATYARVRDVILEGQLRYQIKAGYWAHLRTSTKRSPLPTPLIDPPKLDQRAIMCAESRGVPIDPIRSTSYSAKTPPGWVKVGSSLVRPWSKDERNKVNQAMFREMMMQENALTIKVRTDFEPELRLRRLRRVRPRPARLRRLRRSHLHVHPRRRHCRRLHQSRRSRMRWRMRWMC